VRLRIHLTVRARGHRTLGVVFALLFHRSPQGVELLPLYVEFAPKKAESFRAVFTDLRPEGIDLLERCVVQLAQPPHATPTPRHPHPTSLWPTHTPVSKR
jgi:hypothetical protein